MKTTDLGSQKEYPAQVPAMVSSKSPQSQEIKFFLLSLFFLKEFFLIHLSSCIKDGICVPATFKSMILFIFLLNVTRCVVLPYSWFKQYTIL